MDLLDDGFEAAKYSAVYLCDNAGSWSITLYLKHPDAKEVIHRMIKIAEVVVENFKVATVDRMGYGWDHLRVINPKLIYCAVTGLGQTEPRSQSLPMTRPCRRFPV